MKALISMIKADVPVLLWGAPGTGKTSALTTLASENDAHLEVLIGSIMDPADLGIPMVKDGEVHISPPSWARRLKKALDQDQEAWLLLDELTCAPPSVQAALLRVVQERKCADLDLTGVRILAAANPTDQAADGNDLSLAMSNRFAHLDWVVETDDWISGELSGWGKPDKSLSPIRSLVTSYVKSCPDALLAPPSCDEEDIKGWPSPRSWSSLSRAIGVLAYENPVMALRSKEGRKICASIIGLGTSTEFVAWCADQDLPAVEDLFSGKAEFPKRGDKVYLMSNMIISHAVANNMVPNLWGLLLKMRKDLQLMIAKRAMYVCEKAKIDPELTSELSVIISNRRKAEHQDLE